jgi:hypothetical protein
LFVSLWGTQADRDENESEATLEPILRLLDLQLQRQRCSRLVHF